MTDTANMIIDKVAETFAGVRGIDAVVLGGSRATGTAGRDSDIDIGIYYDAGTFDLDDFRGRAALIDDEHRRDAVTAPGEWGLWINGGGWLRVGGMPVDFLFRDTAKVSSVIGQCLAGEITIDYQCGHPFGFVNSIYAGEAAACRELSCANERLREEKARLVPFPEKYRRAAMDKFLWECWFSAMCGRKSAGKGDVVYAAGSLFRCAVSLMQVLFAFNRMFMINEKGALARLVNEKNVYLPDGFADDIITSFSAQDGESIAGSFDKIERQYRRIAEKAALE